MAPVVDDGSYAARRRAKPVFIDTTQAGDRRAPATYMGRETQATEARGLLREVQQVIDEEHGRRRSGITPGVRPLP